VLLGSGLIFLNPAWTWLHVPAVLWSSAVNLMSGTCPLTPVEKALRTRAGQSGYSGGFVEHYIGRLIYPRGMPRQLELTAGVSVLVWNALAYGIVLVAAR
jgi:hypothetical protein